MAEPNPYLDDSDDDLLGDDSKGKDVHDRSMPPSMGEQLASYFKGYGPGRNGHVHTEECVIPLMTHTVSGFFTYFYDVTMYREYGPLISAMAEVLNEMSDGYLEAIYQLKEAERKIYTTHSVMKAVNVFMTLEQAEDTLNIRAEMVSYFKTFGALTEFVQQRAVNLYLHLCQQLGREPDQGLIETGYYTNRNTFTRIGQGRPPAVNDVY